MELIYSKKISSVFNELNNNDFDLESKNLSKINALFSNSLKSKSFKKEYNQIVKNQNANEILNIFYSLFGRPFNYYGYYENNSYLKKNNEKKLPILGIKGPNFLNSLLHFVLNIPTIKYLFDFLPKSFFALNVFLDSYESDLKNDKKIATLSSDIIFNSLKQVISKDFFNNFKIDFLKLISIIFSYKNFQNIEILNSKNHVIIKHDIDTNFENIVNNFFNGMNPKEFLVQYKGFLEIKNNFKVKNTLFLNSSFYELLSFIEYRNDFFNQDTFLTYVKKENIWYQCEDIKIKIINKDYLHLALDSACLLYYKKVIK
ncbi:MAG: hypothetical protein A3F40_01745 [Chlamydiae bacterium RIFCSPHIGHO2_12_FULL_27_8]|nr:MAG: hypothetical protein A3F40_01745 [Chlamydiae bacterium RIFCSPHIGHO2_12_FULL_27_8]